MKYLGKKDGSNYYVRPDIDGTGLNSPLFDDNLWTLLGFGEFSLDKQVDGLEGLQDWLESKLHHCLTGETLEDLRDRCIAAGVSETGFFDKLAARLDREGVILEPVSVYQHDCVQFFRGVACGWDSGVNAVAVVFKDELRSEYDRKRVTPWIKKAAGKLLELELDHLNDDNNGNLVWIFKDPDTAAADDLGGIYGTDYDNAPDKLEFVSSFL